MVTGRPDTAGLAPDGDTAGLAFDGDTAGLAPDGDTAGLALDGDAGGLARGSDADGADRGAGADEQPASSTAAATRFHETLMRHLTRAGGSGSRPAVPEADRP
jgi:hypothetical protein